MKLSIYSIQNTLFEGECEKVIAHTPEGQITILAHHIPLVTRLVGPMLTAVDRNAHSQDIPLNGGIMEVRPDSEILILVDA